MISSFLNPPRSWFPNAPKIFNWAGWLFLRILGALAGFRGQGLENFPKKGPCLVIVPHVNFIDPLFLIATLPRPPHFIADAFFTFRHPVLAWAMWINGTVPVERSHPDVYAVRQYLRLLAKGEVCVLFPEGGRNLDGEVLAPTIQAVKLIAKCNVPVVTCVIEGAYDAWPKWDPTFRLPWGKINVRYAGIFKQEGSAPPSKNGFWWNPIYDRKTKIDIAQEREKIKQALATASRQESANIVLTRSKRPQAISNLLCFCPVCGTPNGLTWNNSDKKLICSKCKITFGIENADLIANAPTGFIKHPLPNWFKIMVQTVTQKKNEECFIATKTTAQVTELKKPKPAQEAASLRIDQFGFSLRTESGLMFQIPLKIAAKASAKGSSVIEISYQNKLITVHSQEGNIIPWVILTRKLAGWKDFFAEN